MRLLSCFFVCSNLKATNEELSNPVNNLYFIDNSQSLVQKKSLEASCEKTCGEKLVECVLSLNVQEQCEVFAKLSSHKRREFLRKLDILNYEKFLKSYSEHDWKKTFNSLTEYEQSYWPQTVKEQIEAIHKIRIAAENASDLAGHIGTTVLSCINPIYLTLTAYNVGYLFTYGTTPIKANYIEFAFKKYMEGTFEI